MVWFIVILVIVFIVLVLPKLNFNNPSKQVEAFLFHDKSKIDTDIDFHCFKRAIQRAWMDMNFDDAIFLHSKVHSFLDKHEKDFLSGSGFGLYERYCKNDDAKQFLFYNALLEVIIAHHSHEYSQNDFKEILHELCTPILIRANSDISM